MTMKELKKMADNTKQITDEFVFRGFIDEGKEELSTYDFGETLVMLAPVGSFQGWNPSTKEPVDETIDNEALDTLIANYNANPVELLLDIDHKSMREPTTRDTTAAGWIYGLIAIKDVADMSGLYGRVKWTDVGRELAESRKYRFISPVFQLDESGRPVQLLNAALTNRPAMNTIAPILNTEAIAQNDFTKEVIDMTKEELVALIDEQIQLKMSLNTEPGKTEEEKTEDTAENGCTEDKADDNTETTDTSSEGGDVATSEGPGDREEVCKSETRISEASGETEEDSDGTTSDSNSIQEEESSEKQGVVESKSAEVIKEEVLNTAPSTRMTPAWQNLHGKAFTDWLAAHPKGY